MIKKKKVLLFVVLMFIFFSGLSVYAAILGDLDDDGAISSVDYTIMRRYLTKTNISISIESADLDADNTIDSIDYTLMRRYLLGKINKFPAEYSGDGYYLKGYNTDLKLKVSEKLNGSDVELTIINAIATSNSELRVVKIENGIQVLQSNVSQLTAGENIQAICYQYKEDSQDHNKIVLYAIDNKVQLDIYSSGRVNIISRKFVNMGQTVEIDIYESSPYYNPAQYFIYASKDNYYTELFYCEKGDEITLDLAKVNNQHKVTGVIFAKSVYPDQITVNNCTVNVFQNNNFITEFKTDEKGIYSCDLDNGEYIFNFQSNQILDSVVVDINDGYQDVYTNHWIPVPKPIVYLYPEEKVSLDVEIVFPNGGIVTKSDPEYGYGWHDILVEPNGVIDGEYRYLFYESENKDFSQFEYGWIVESDKLEEFFRENMGQYGFNEQEIADFIEYWIEEEHLSNEYKYYAIYPQLAEDIEKEIVLKISQEPDSILRLVYTFVGMDNPNINIEEPIIKNFEREGFVVTEWGGILK